MTSDVTVLKLPHLIALTEHAMRQRVNEALAPLDVGVRHLAALELLAANARLTVAELARAVYVTRQSMHTLIGDLIDKGYVTQQARGHGRRLDLVLTASGKRFLRACQRIADEVEQDLFSSVTEEQRQTVRWVLGEVLSHCATDAAPTP
jgi:DNA-binding MarR family transcriptional regulator